MTLAPDVDLQNLGKLTPGYVGSDLSTLCSEAGLEAIRRIVQESSSQTPTISLCAAHKDVFQNILNSTQSSTLFSTAKDPPSSPFVVAADDFGDLDESEMEREFERSEDAMIMANSLDHDDTKNFQSVSQLSTSLPELSDCFYCSLMCNSSSSEMSGFVSINMNDFSIAIKSVQPSAKREGFAVVPDVTWADVGALSEVH